MLKVLTFNVRFETESDGINAQRFRRPLMIEAIKKYSPDIIGFQEFQDHTLRDFRDNLPEYDFVAGYGRDTDLTGERTSIAYKRKRFDLCEASCSWLSTSPHTPGSRYGLDQSPCPRTFTSAVLYDLETGKLIRMYNTHLDHEGDKARTLGMSDILKKIYLDSEYIKDSTVVLTGDFNAEPDETPVELIRDTGLTDTTSDITLSVHHYGKLRPGENKIDYIFTNKPFKNTKCWTDITKDGVYLSDHYPISTEITE